MPLERAPSATEEHRGYRPDVDGLRAVAVLGVLGYHFFPELLPGGFTGVDVFFVISGYLISGNILREIRAERFSFRDFYARRARRILPALLVVLAAVLAFGWWSLFPEEFVRLRQHSAAAAVFASNLLLWQEAGYFDVAAHLKPLLHLWSLGVEEQFYLIWPVLLWLIAGRTKRGPGPVIALLFGASFLTGLSLQSNHPVAAFYLLPGRLWELALGAGLAASEADRRPRSPAALAAGSLIGAFLIALGYFGLRPTQAFPGWRALLPVVGSTLVIAGGVRALPNRLLGARALVAVGLVSYPLYLWHWPLFVLARLYANSVLGIGARAIMILASLTLAVLTYRLVEQPIRRRHSGRDAGLLLGLLLLLGALTVSSFGERQSMGFRDAADSTTREAQTCAAKYGLPLGVRTYCSESLPGRPPDIVVLGDSHALALWPGVIEANPGLNVVLIGGSGCPFLRQTRYYSTPLERDDCPPLIDAGFRAFGAGRGKFVLVARMPIYVEGTRFGIDEGDAPVGTFDSPAFPGQTAKEFVARALDRDLSYLTSRGNTVDLVQPVPEIGFNPRACGGPRRPGAPRPPHDCGLARTEVEARQKSYRDLARDALARVQSPRVRVVDPMEALCDSTRCFARRDDRLLYADNSHLSKDGAIYVWLRIAPK